MKKLLVVLALSLGMAACVPVNPPPPPPEPGPVEPVVETEELTGTWTGNLLGIQEIVIPVELVTVEEDNVITGTIELTDEPQETIGSINGVVTDTGRTVLTASVSSEQRTLNFTFDGVVSDGRYVGNTSTLRLSSSFITPTSFNLVITGE